MISIWPAGARRNRVKWLDPAGYRRWRDLGLAGMTVDGRPDPAFRGRNEQRDCAFADGLYGSGLRLSEWASVVLPELPGDDPGRGYSTCRLADACAKNGYGHVYWLPRHALVDVLNYVEGARARIVRAAQRAGRYDVVDEKELVLHSTNREVVQRHSGGTQRKVSLNILDPARRRKLYRMTKQGLEPLALWLNEDGSPRPAHSWEHTFQDANRRIARLGLTNFTATPHMLRHSCALRWYAIGRLAYEKRFAHLTEEEAKTSDNSLAIPGTWSRLISAIETPKPPNGFIWSRSGRWMLKYSCSTRRTLRCRPSSPTIWRITHW